MAHSALRKYVRLEHAVRLWVRCRIPLSLSILLARHRLLRAFRTSLGIADTKQFSGGVFLSSRA